MAVSDQFLDFLLDQLSDWDGITTRRMFGGCGIYRHRTIFALVADDILYLKTDDSTREEFVRAGAVPFHPFGEDKEVSSYYTLPPDAPEDRKEFNRWVKKALSLNGK